MRTLCTIVVLGVIQVLNCPCIRAATTETVRFELSEPQALLIFVEAIADYPHRPTSLRRTFEESAFNTPESRKFIADFQSLHESLHRGAAGDKFPQSNHEALDVHQILLLQAAQSRDIEELGSRARGLLEIPDYVTFLQVVHHFQPIYLALIWTRHLSEMKTMTVTFRQFAADSRFSESIELAKKFYAADWPMDTPITIYLYPLPKGSHESAAEHLDVTAAVSAEIGSSVDANRIGIVFHEICHALYDSQSQPTRAKFASYFEGRDSNSLRAFDYVNEVLATTLGNGWMFERVAGHLDQTLWYDNPVIDNTARAMLPIVTQYLLQARPVDRALISKYLDLFESSDRGREKELRLRLPPQTPPHVAGSNTAAESL